MSLKILLPVMSLAPMQIMERDTDLELGSETLVGGFDYLGDILEVGFGGSEERHAGRKRRRIPGVTEELHWYTLRQIVSKGRLTTLSANLPTIIANPITSLSTPLPTLQTHLLLSLYA
jgi:hypothetical protein